MYPVYILLLLCGVVKLTYGFIPFDILGFKTGLNYIFWFALGYVFEIERHQHKKWNMRKTALAYAVTLAIEVGNGWGGIRPILDGSVRGFSYVSAGRYFVQNFC